MARQKIRPEVLRPFILAVAMIVALFVFQFLRPIPPDIRMQNLQKAYAADLQRLYGGLQQYQSQYKVLPAGWPDLLTAGFPLESLEVPDAEPKHPVVVKGPEGVQVRNMPFKLLQQGAVDFAGPRRPLVEVAGAKEAPLATLYSNGTIEWAHRQ